LFRHIGIELRLPHEKAPFTVEDYARTIEQHQLFPRAKIMVLNTLTASMKQMDATVRLEEAKIKADQEVASKKKKESDERRLDRLDI
jgi:hypothetical protein